MRCQGYVVRIEDAAIAKGNDNFWLARPKPGAALLAAGPVEIGAFTAEVLGQFREGFKRRVACARGEAIQDAFNYAAGLKIKEKFKLDLT